MPDFDLTASRAPTAQAPEPWEIWNAILEKAAASGFPALTPAESVIYRVNTYLAEFEMGGFSGALYNLSPALSLAFDPSGKSWEGLRSVASALDEVGDALASELWAKCAERLESGYGAVAALAEPWTAVVELARNDPEAGRIDEILQLRLEAAWGLLEIFTRARLQSTGEDESEGLLREE